MNAAFIVTGYGSISSAEDATLSEECEAVFPHSQGGTLQQ
jgi:hypothetical protein